MKISQLIEDLQRALENEGDLRIAVDDIDGARFSDIELYVDVVHWSGKKQLVICEKPYEGN